jgi:TRAP-type C4-dicarboxylate transport system substrate-binding protein
MNARVTRSFCVLAAGVLALSACAGPTAAPIDKIGSETVTLRLASIDDVNGNGISYGPEAFVKALDTVSGGHLKVDVTTSYGGGRAESESNLVKALASGEVDLGWPSARSFANGGIHGFGAVEAPMTITSYAAMKALVTAPVADKFLARLDGTGIAGLGLAVGTLRRPFATTAPLLGPSDWTGVPFRAFNSPVQSEAIQALGGSPVNLGGEWIDAIHAGTLRGAEFDVAQYQWNGFGSDAPFVTANVVLWPKVFVLSINRKRFESLTEQQRAWVHAAAQAATKASVDATYDETTMAKDLCSRGVRFVEASDDQVRALRAKLAPVIARLAADAVDGPLLADVQAIAADDPTVDIPDVPADCRQVPAAGPAPSIPTARSSLPDGTYRQAVTSADLAALNVGNGPGWTGTWTLTIHDGTYALTCRFLDDPQRDCGNAGVEGVVLEAGYVRGTGAEVYFVGDGGVESRMTGCKLPPSDQPGYCFVLPPYGYTWSIEGKQLTFTHPVPTNAAAFGFTPWTKID